MGAYQLLFSVTVEHMYFANLACRSLEFVPTQETNQLFKRSGLLLKVSENRLSIYFENDTLDILRLYAADESLAFTFKVYSKDTNFSVYTTPAIHPLNAILYFDNHQTCQDLNGRCLLHHKPFVSEDDYSDVHSDKVCESLEPRDFYILPCFIVKIMVPDDTSLLSLNQSDAHFRHFFIAFASNKTFWKYYLMGDLSNRTLQIADLDEEIQFTEIGAEKLPGNHVAKVLQSTHAIPMYERPVQRLQLKETIDQREKILIKRLPNASVNQVHGEYINGRMENISEVYIH